MKIPLLIKMTKRLRLHSMECAAFMLCVIGVGLAIPIHAQQKPKKAPMHSVSSSVPYGYNQVGDTKLYYYQSSNSIDVQGFFNDLYYGSTYNNYGYHVAMQVNEGTPEIVNCLEGSTIDGVSFVASIEPQGELARICYTVTNTTEQDVTVSLGTHADVMIGNNDLAPLSRRIDTNGSTYGVTMKDGNGAQLCVLFGSGLAGVTAVSDYWFGFFYLNSDPNSMVGNYTSGDNYMEEDGSYDSGMGWCWKNKPVAAGSTVVFSYLIGVGDVSLEPNSSFEVSPDDPDGWNDMSRPHKLTLEGTYESPAGLDGKVEYAVEDSEEWKPLTEMMSSGSTFKDTLVAMFDASREKHVIRFRTIDNVGNTTMLHPIEYIDVSFHQYSGVTDKTYTGDSLFQDVSCVDIENLQVTTGRYYNNVNAGTASFSIEGVFPYTIGRKSGTFTITPAPLTGEINLASNSFVYDGKEHLPGWTFTNESYASLAEDKDYDVIYSNNINPGTATLTVRGKGNYTSELTNTFFIDKAQLTGNLYSITLPDADVSYDGNEHTAVVTAENGVGEATLSYACHGDTIRFAEGPKDEGCYDIYVEIADGDLYYGKPRECVGTFSIYRFDESEWQTVCGLLEELKNMNVVLPWDITGGSKNVGKFEELTVKEGHVVGISLANKGMTGLFPTVLSAFPKLAAIDISNNNLSGDIGMAIAAMKKLNAQTFVALRSLDISHNRYTGNVGLLGNCMSNLDSLNVSYNKFEDLYPALPSSIIRLDISHQDMDKVVDLNMSDLSLSDMATKVPTILLYDKETCGYRNSINLLCTKANLKTFNKNETEEWAMQLKIADNSISIPYVSRHNAYYGTSGDTLNVLNMIDDDITDGSNFRISLSFNNGDANFVNGVDATDLQATILYAYGLYHNYPFNFTAADTYKDDNINVQDVVCTVDILLKSSEQQSVAPSGSRVNSADMTVDNDCNASIYMSNGKIYLNSKLPVASLSIKAEGDIKWRLNALGMEQSTLRGNVVAYSLNGTTIPSYEDVVIGEYTHATVHSASLSDNEAQSISVGFNGGTPTGISGVSIAEEDNRDIYNVSGYKTNTMGNGVNIIRSNGKTQKIFKK